MSESESPQNLNQDRLISRIQLSDEAVAGEYTRLLGSRWRLIALLAFLAGVGTYAITTLLMTQWFRAEAVLRPTSLQARMGQGVSLSASLPLELLGMRQQDDQAQEYMSILKSYSFTTRLLQKYAGASHLLSTTDLNSLNAYRIMSKRFDCEYDRFDGNLTLHFLDPSPKVAAEVLNLYVDNLRDQLRSREIDSATKALESLHEETRVTSDTLLQTQLYELIAEQVRRQKLAQVEADFAFEVIDRPVAPDRSFSPRPVIDAIAAAVMIAFAVGTTLVIAYESRLPRVQTLRASEAARPAASTGGGRARTR